MNDQNVSDHPDASESVTKDLPILRPILILIPVPTREPLATLFLVVIPLVLSIIVVDVALTKLVLPSLSSTPTDPARPVLPSTSRPVVVPYDASVTLSPGLVVIVVIVVALVVSTTVTIVVVAVPRRSTVTVLIIIIVVPVVPPSPEPAGRLVVVAVVSFIIVILVISAGLVSVLLPVDPGLRESLLGLFGGVVLGLRR